MFRWKQPKFLAMGEWINTRILFSNKKEGAFDECHNMSVSQRYYAECKSYFIRIHIVWFHLYDILEKANYRMENRSVAAWDKSGKRVQHIGAT